MAMQDHTEIGWVITNKDSDKYVGPIMKSNDDEIPCTNNHPDAHDSGILRIETHPMIRGIVFVSLVWPEHGFLFSDLEEPATLHNLVRNHVLKLDPEAVITYGIIITRR